MPDRERTRYYAGQLVVAEDLTQDQTYVRERLRRHNRLLHGWGVVTGAAVRLGQTAATVTVDPGYVLTPAGEEIRIPDPVEVDMTRQALDGTAPTSASPAGAGVPVQGGDPFAVSIMAPRSPGQVLYLAVQYTEQLSRPVPSLASPCGCDDGRCEYTRIRDSYAFAALTTLPSSYGLGTEAPPAPGARPEMPTLPPVPSDPWVILADVTMADADRVHSVDLTTHRRQAVTTAALWTRPAASLTGFVVTPASLVGAGALQGRVLLGGPTSDFGGEVVLTSSIPAALAVPPSVMLGAHMTETAFELTAAPVSAATVVTVTATYSGSSLQATVTLLPPGGPGPAPPPTATAAGCPRRPDVLSHVGHDRRHRRRPVDASRPRACRRPTGDHADEQHPGVPAGPVGDRAARTDPGRVRDARRRGDAPDRGEPVRDLPGPDAQRDRAGAAPATARRSSSSGQLSQHRQHR